MSHKIFNILSEDETLFGSDDSFGGWEVTSTNGRLVRINEKGFYPTYVPGSRPGYNFIKNVLMVYSVETGDIVVKSPWLSAKSLYRYMVSVYMAVEGTDANISLDFEVNSTSSGTGNTYATDSTLTAPVSVDLSDGDPGLLFRNYNTLQGTSFVRMVVTFAGQGSASLPAECALFLYDPVVCEDNLTDAGEFANIMYNLLPSFMLLDDENITSISDNTTLLPYPLLRFVESLTAPATEIADIATDFDYLRPVDGEESKSMLTDPVSAKAGYLLWLANVTGTNLLTAASGFTPWAAFDGFDWQDFDDIDTVIDTDDSVEWLQLQNLSTDFFDTVQGYRDQIRTGFSGINAGRRDAIVAYLRTLLQSGSADSDVVVVKTGDKDSPYKIQLLVDPDGDPDPSGTQLSDAVNNSMTVGGIASKTNTVLLSGEGSYDFASLVYPASESNENSGGVVVFGQPFVSDRDGYARHIVLNSTVGASTTPVVELGGGIGNAHFEDGVQFHYGSLNSGSGTASLVSYTSDADLGGSSGNNGLDVVVVLSDVVAPTAAISTTDGSGTPSNWLFREKRLLVSGVDSDSGTKNDWAVYLVSGLTTEPDNDCRLLFVNGYNSQTGTNYAYSNPINIGQLNHSGQFVLRVSMSAISAGDATVNFYAQRSLYDDWTAHSLGESVITPTSVVSGSGPGVQVLGNLDQANTSDWAYAESVVCAISRVMLYSSPISFVGEGVTPIDSQAYIMGGGAGDYAVYTYTPDVDIDCANASVYDTSFDGADSGGNAITVTLTKAATNYFDVLAARPIGGQTAFWYFGHAASGGDTLSIDGLSASTSHVVKVTVYNAATGVETEYSHAVTADGSGVLTISAQDIYTGSTTYAGSSIKQISVEESSIEVAKFLPTTILATATTGADSVNSNNTWTLTRNFPASNVAYAPSQLVDKSFIHAYEGQPSLSHPAKIETHLAFSVVFKIRRFWNTGTFEVYKLHSVDSDGLTVYFEDDYLKASFTAGSVVERLAWQESAVGEWNTVVIRRDPSANFSMVVNGSEVDSTAVAVDSVFENEITVAGLSEGSNGAWNPRFGLAEFCWFNRYLFDSEITLLNSQIS